MFIEQNTYRGVRIPTRRAFTASAAPRPAATIEVSTAAQLKAALGSADPGDTIRLADGTYTGNAKTSEAANSGSRITLTGSSKAVLKTGGGYGLHLDGASYWTVRGITVTGGQRDEQQRRLPDVGVREQHGQGRQGAHEHPRDAVRRAGSARRAPPPEGAYECQPLQPVLSLSSSEVL